MVEVVVDEPPGQPLPPEQTHASLGEPIEDRRHRTGCKYTEIEYGLPNEFSHVAVRDGRHEVTAHVAVHDIQAVDCERQCNEPCEQRLGFPTNLGSREALDPLNESIPGQPVDRNLLYIRSYAIHCCCAPRSSLRLPAITLPYNPRFI